MDKEWRFEECGEYLYSDLMYTYTQKNRLGVDW